jgi:hypothetical protein
VQETVSLMNLDFWRLARGVNPLSADGLLDKPLVHPSGIEGLIFWALGWRYPARGLPA